MSRRAPWHSGSGGAQSTYAWVGVGVVGGIAGDGDVAELGAARVDRVGLVAVEALELRTIRLEEAEEVVEAPETSERGRDEVQGERERREGDRASGREVGGRDRRDRAVGSSSQTWSAVR